MKEESEKLYDASQCTRDWNVVDTRSTDESPRGHAVIWRARGCTMARPAMLCPRATAHVTEAARALVADNNRRAGGDDVLSRGVTAVGSDEELHAHEQLRTRTGARPVAISMQMHDASSPCMMHCPSTSMYALLLAEPARLPHVLLPIVVLWLIQ